MSYLDSLHDFLVKEHSFELKKKTDNYLEYESKSMQLRIQKDMSDFKVFSLDGKRDVYTLKKELTVYIGEPMGILKALLEHCLQEDEREREKDRHIESKEEYDVVDGFLDDVEVLEKVNDLPICECDEDRQLIIYVWGRKKRKYLHHKVDHNFNGAVLYGKKAGTDWSKDGRTEAIRTAVMKCPIFNDFLETMVKTIEKKDASKIGINCRAGRHRSVTLAWILREHYYKNAKINLLEIK